MMSDIKKTNSSKKAFFKNVVVVLISNIFSVISGVLIGFVVPKIMGISDYGYYRTFTLYSSYVGILHFGFIDGIYLLFAGKKFEELEKNKFRTYTVFLFSLEFVITIVAVCLSFLTLGTPYFLVFLCVSLNIFITNIGTYYEFISQITMRFKRSAIRNIIRYSLNSVSVVTLFLIYKLNGAVIYGYYLMFITLLINAVLSIWYLYTYRDITFGKRNSIKEELEEIKVFFKKGIVLMLSNLIAQIIFIVDLQFVNIAFDNETYALYAFAYNMINLITIATSALSIVLYPTLRTINSETIASNYSNLNSYLLIFVSFCLIIYFPLYYFVIFFLPKYSGSLSTFMIILPGVLISSSISVIKYNCYKTFDAIKEYFFKSLFALFLAIVADLIVYYIFKNTAAISIVSIFVLIIWYVLVELFFVKKYHTPWIKNFVYMIIILCGFYGLSFIAQKYISAILYFFLYLLITFIFYNKQIKYLLHNYKRKKQQ